MDRKMYVSVKFVNDQNDLEEGKLFQMKIVSYYLIRESKGFN